MTRTENERLAVVENDVRHLSVRHEEFRQEVRNEFRSVGDRVAAMDDKIDRIEEILTKAQGGWTAIVGGWRTVVAVGGFLSGVAALVHWIWNILSPLAGGLPR